MRSESCRAMTFDESSYGTGGTASGHREGPPAPATAPGWKFQLLCMRLDMVRQC